MSKSYKRLDEELSSYENLNSFYDENLLDDFQQKILKERSFRKITEEEKEFFTDRVRNLRDNLTDIEYTEDSDDWGDYDSQEIYDGELNPRNIISGRKVM